MKTIGTVCRRNLPALGILLVIVLSFSQPLFGKPVIADKTVVPLGISEFRIEKLSFSDDLRVVIYGLEFDGTSQLCFEAHLTEYRKSMSAFAYISPLFDYCLIQVYEDSLLTLEKKVAIARTITETYPAVIYDIIRQISFKNEKNLLISPASGTGSIAQVGTLEDLSIYDELSGSFTSYYVSNAREPLSVYGFYAFYAIALGAVMLLRKRKWALIVVLVFFTLTFFWILSREKGGESVVTLSVPPLDRSGNISINGQFSGSELISGGKNWMSYTIVLTPDNSVTQPPPAENSVEAEIESAHFPGTSRLVFMKVSSRDGDCPFEWFHPYSPLIFNDIPDITYNGVTYEIKFDKLLECWYYRQ